MRRKTKRIICIALTYTLFCLIAVLVKNFVDLKTEAQPLESSSEEKTDQEMEAAKEPVIQVVTPGTGHVVCIDAGHQQYADMKKEPIGPDATKKKPRVDVTNKGAEPYGSAPSQFIFYSALNATCTTGGCRRWDILWGWGCLRCGWSNHICGTGS